MPYSLGIDLGTTRTTAAVYRPDRGSEPEAVTLGGRSAGLASVLHLGEDGSVLVGEAAEQRACSEPDRTLRGFLRRVGDETPCYVGGDAYPAEDLAAILIRWFYEHVSEQEGEAPEGVALTHPAGWGPHRTGLLAEAVRRVGLGAAVLLPAAEAAAASYAAQQRLPDGSHVAVYDLGGATFAATVLTKAGDEFTARGRPVSLDDLGGVDFDEAVLRHACASADADNAAAELSRDDPDVLAEFARLRSQSTEAKETLSAETAVDIPVALGGLRSTVRLVRGEFEQLIRPALGRTVDALGGALASAEVDADELAAVLLVGGSSRIPLVAELVAAEFGLTPTVRTDPDTTAAAGAALALAAQVEPAPHPEIAAESTREQQPVRPPVEGLLPAEQTDPGMESADPVAAGPLDAAEPPRRLSPAGSKRRYALAGGTAALLLAAGCGVLVTQGPAWFGAGHAGATSPPGSTSPPVVNAVPDQAGPGGARSGTHPRGNLRAGGAGNGGRHRAVPNGRHRAADGPKSVDVTRAGSEHLLARPDRGAASTPTRAGTHRIVRQSQPTSRSWHTSWSHAREWSEPPATSGASSGGETAAQGGRDTGTHRDETGKDGGHHTQSGETSSTDTPSSSGSGGQSSSGSGGSPGSGGAQSPGDEGTGQSPTTQSGSGTESPEPGGKHRSQSTEQHDSEANQSGAPAGSTTG